MAKKTKDKCQICGGEKELVLVISRYTFCIDCQATKNLVQAWLGYCSARFSLWMSALAASALGGVAIMNTIVYIFHGEHWFTMFFTQLVVGLHILVCRDNVRKMREARNEMFVARCAGPDSFMAEAYRHCDMIMCDS